MVWVWLAALMGCDSPGETEITWHSQVAPVMAEKCGDCHYDGGPGPFDARDYAQVKEWAPAIQDAIANERMPPFAARESEACEQEVGFKDDGSLAPEQRTLLDTWFAADAPEGDPDAASEVRERVVLDLEDPDVVVGFQETFAVSGDRDIYQCFRVQVPGDADDRWITGMQVIPGNDRVVHHVLVWTDPYDQSLAEGGAEGNYACDGDPDVFPTELVGTWVPGASPMITPEGTGVTLRAGSTLVVNVHYHPTGDSTELDDTRVALKFAEERPESFATWYLVDLPFGASEATPPFEIPADAEEHVEEVTLTNPLPFEVKVFAISPHMHYLGTGMKVTLEREGAEQCLVHTPSYRFDFQMSYVYDAPIDQLPTYGFGDTVRVECTYNNSMSNPYMPLALEAAGSEVPITVGWGEETADEMCMAMVGLISPVEVLDLLDLFL